MYVRSEWTLVCLAWCACSAPTPPGKPPAAATVQNRVTETTLTTVTLSDSAVQRLGVQTAAVTERSAPRERLVAAEAVVPPGKSVVVSAPMAGVVLLAANLAPGAAVKRGQLVMRLSPLPTAAELNAAEARLDIARKRAARNAELVKEGAVAQRSNEDAQLELAMAEANLAAARPGSGGRASIPLLASRDGVLRDLRVADGQAVAAGLPLYQLDALDVLWVRAAVPPGVASTTTSASAQSLDGHTRRALREVAAPPSAELLSATVDRWFALDNDDAAFRPGQRLVVSLREAGDAPQPVVPSSAIIIDVYGGEWVYVAREDHRFTRQRVAVRFVEGDEAVLTRGPAAGVQVVTVGTTELFGVEFGAGK